jgi:hypothetical protein
MDENALKLLDVLPEDGSKMGGAEVKKLCGLKLSDFKAAKTYLRDNGLVTLGRGRGGSVAAIMGAERPVEAPTLTKGEKIALAHEEKAELTRAQKEREVVREMAKEQANEMYPDADEIQVQVVDVNMGKTYITIWKDKKGKVGELYV